MIEFHDLSLTYGSKTVLDHIDLTLAPGQRVALMGPSGCGKTSLLRIAAGLTAPTSGQALIRARRLAYAFQEPRLMPWRTAAENVNAVLLDGAATMPEALRWLEAVGLSEAADKFPVELSGGMKQRVDLARALACDGDLLLLDEPTKELDTDTRRRILDLLGEHVKGRTLLLATHSMDEAALLAERIYVIENGRLRPTQTQ